MITDTDVQAAEMRMQETLSTSPRATMARYDRRVSRIVISLNSGLELAFPPHIVEGLRICISQAYSQEYSAHRTGWPLV